MSSTSSKCRFYVQEMEHSALVMLAFHCLDAAIEVCVSGILQHRVGPSRYGQLGW